MMGLRVCLRNWRTHMPQGRSKIPRATTKTKQIPLPLRAGQEDPGFIWCFTESGALILLIRKRWITGPQCWTVTRMSLGVLPSILSHSIPAVRYTATASESLTPGLRPGWTVHPPCCIVGDKIVLFGGISLSPVGELGRWIWPHRSFWLTHFGL